MYADQMVKMWVNDHTLRPPEIKNAPAFERNIEQALDIL